MTNHLILVPIVYLAALYDTSFGSDIGLASPDGLALVALAWALTFAGPRGFLATGAIGFVSDLVSPGRLGPGLACFAIVGYFLPRLHAHLGARHPQTLAILGWSAATIMVLAPAMARRALGEVDLNWMTLVIRGLAVGACTAAMTLPVLIVIARIRRTRRQRGWA